MKNWEKKNFMKTNLYQWETMKEESTEDFFSSRLGSIYQGGEIVESPEIHRVWCAQVVNNSQRVREHNSSILDADAEEETVRVTGHEKQPGLLQARGLAVRQQAHVSLGRRSSGARIQNAARSQRSWWTPIRGIDYRAIREISSHLQKTS